MTSQHEPARPAHHPVWLVIVSLMVTLGLFVWAAPAMLRNLSPSETASQTAAPQTAAPQTAAPQTAAPQTTAPQTSTLTTQPTPTLTATPEDEAQPTPAVTQSATVELHPTPIPTSARTAAELPDLIVEGACPDVEEEGHLADAVPPRGLEPPSLPRERIALTFDCGYNIDSLNRILAMLAEHRARATFFFEGAWVARTPMVISTTVASGHEIGSHSYSHPDFRTLTQAQVAWELDTTATLIERAGSPARVTLFRYPYGARTLQTDAWVIERGYQIVGWSIDPKGWRAGTTPQQVIDHLRAHAEPNGIVLMHCGSTTDERALEGIIRDLHAANYELVTVSALEGD
jgi:peptidoglycan/xylan/chitin deacetylase (PgdA/CDA1 family)